MNLEIFVRHVDNEDFPLPSREGVEAFEAQTATTLPEDYRNFLALMPGGSIPATVTFSFPGSSGSTEYLGSVLGLRPDGYLSLVRHVRDAEAEGIPQAMLPIMVDTGGNVLALAVRPDRLGEVFFLDHEIAVEGRPSIEDAEAQGWGYALPLAPSFTAFLDMLKIADEP
jgi:hypothetical protein